MAMEQARGKRLGKWADIWSFGMVLYAMLTGQQMFGGGTVSDSMAGVLETEIDLRALHDDTPLPIRKLLSHSLERHGKQRRHDIANARLGIEEALLTGTYPDITVYDAEAWNCIIEISEGPAKTLSIPADFLNLTRGRQQTRKLLPLRGAEAA